MPHKLPEDRRKYQAAWRAKNRAKTVAASRRHRERNLESVRAEARERNNATYHAKLKHDPAFMAANRAKAQKWYEANPEKAKKRIASYRRNSLIVPRQTPKWANRFFISEIYDLAKRRTKALGVPHEVDHIIPLRGKTVCGLHVESNLRVVPKAVNRAKSSKFSEHYHAVY